MRLRNNPNAQKQLEQSNYLVQIFPYKVFSNTVIELGMGKGKMITELAKNNSKINYLGIEKSPTVALKAVKKAESKNLNNFKIICADIKNLNNLIKGKVKKIWLTFPDPWPKKRHAKRRLTHVNFINLYKNILLKNGKVLLKTDNDKLFNWTINHLSENKIKIKNITTDFHNHDASQDNIMTSYEKKWSSAGKKINYLEINF